MISDRRKRMMKIKNKNRAIELALAAMLVNPNNAAMMATTKNVRDQ